MSHNTNPKPLKTDILKDIFSALPEEKGISRKSLREVVASYVRKNAYHRSLIQSTHRVNLGGQPVQDIDPAHKVYAQDVLERRRLKKLGKQARRKEIKKESVNKD